MCEETYSEDVEGYNDHQGKEQGVIVEDRKCGGLVLCDLKEQNIRN